MAIHLAVYVATYCDGRANWLYVCLLQQYVADHITEFFQFIFGQILAILYNLYPFVDITHYFSSVLCSAPKAS